MLLNLIIEDYSMDLSLSPEELVTLAPLFIKMDMDMDKGIQLGATWIDKPDKLQRCQLAADRLLEALQTHNEKLAKMMAGYIVKRKTEVKTVQINSNGMPEETQFILHKA